MMLRWFKVKELRPEEESLRTIYTLAYRLTGDTRVAAGLAGEACVHLSGKGLNRNSLLEARLRALKEISDCYLQKYRHLPAQNPAPDDSNPKVQQALNTLPPEEKVVVVLRDVFVLSLVEVGSVLDWPHKKVVSTLGQARRTLCQQLRTKTKFKEQSNVYPPCGVRRFPAGGQESRSG